MNIGKAVYVKPCEDVFEWVGVHLHVGRVGSDAAEMLPNPPHGLHVCVEPAARPPYEATAGTAVQDLKGQEATRGDAREELIEEKEAGPDRNVLHDQSAVHEVELAVRG
jgi:hypothetical protein